MRGSRPARNAGHGSRRTEGSPRLPAPYRPPSTATCPPWDRLQPVGSYLPRTTTTCPWRAQSMASARMRAASCGAWKPVEFSAFTKSTRHCARRWSFSPAWSRDSATPAARAALPGTPRRDTMPTARRRAAVQPN